MERTQPYSLALRQDAVLHHQAAPLPHAHMPAALLAAMRKLMEAHDGIGIAAPQVGESLRVFLVAKDLFPENVREKIPSDVFINPKIVRRGFKRAEEEEGCLSVPRVYGVVKRPLRVTVEAHTPSGKKFRLAAEGLLARVLQHEMDHLDGALFIEKAEKKTLHELFPDGTVQPWHL